MCNWFCQISKTTISTKVLVSRLHRLKTLVSKKRGEKKSMLLKELFEIDTSEASAKQAPHGNSLLFVGNHLIQISIYQLLQIFHLPVS
jgi:hypothetical protein